MKTFLALIVATILVAGPAQSSPDMKAMMAEMQSCSVCKHMAPHMATLGPAMTCEIVSLNDGVAVIHGMTDADQMPLFREVSEKMHTAGEAAMTDEHAELCSACQQFRDLMTAGAKLHMGTTETGDIMALTSDDPAVQAQIAEVGTQMRQMVEMMEHVEG